MNAPPANIFGKMFGLWSFGNAYETAHARSFWKWGPTGHTNGTWKSLWWRVEDFISVNIWLTHPRRICQNSVLLSRGHGWDRTLTTQRHHSCVWLSEAVEPVSGVSLDTVDLISSVCGPRTAPRGRGQWKHRHEAFIKCILPTYPRWPIHPCSF